MPLVLEALIATTNADGSMHLAPMGPHVPGTAFTQFTLRPFATSQTYRNLCRYREGVLHVTDDALLLAKTAIGEAVAPPARLADRVAGFIVTTACHYHEFAVTDIDDRTERVAMTAEVRASGRLRDWFGFNRAKHAVVEAAILATRVHLLNRADILADYDRWQIVVEKTGGEDEHEAMRLLRAYVEGGRP